MVNMPDRPHVHVRLRPLKPLLRHRSPFLRCAIKISTRTEGTYTTTSSLELVFGGVYQNLVHSVVLEFAILNTISEESTAYSSRYPGSLSSLLFPCFFFKPRETPVVFK